ncbi:MAG: Hsp33 family molecular chaperone HslO [Zoogloeaceae bacterium]|jgi:molecular chaperone Hsp33|nr:Hsp33 family molecular chaperone HslO [Zoogloeaceae bacterium]
MSGSGVTRFLFPRLDIRGACAQLRGAWREMRADRGYAPATAELLGEIAAVASLIAAQLKQPGRLTLQLRGEGPVSLLLVDCDGTADETHTTHATLSLRGMARAPANLSPAPAAQLLGVDKGGQLLLSLDLPEMRHPYQSFVPLHGETLAEIFTHYLEQSEQQSAFLSLAADENTAFALFLQKMPNADAADPDGWNRLTQLAATARREELLTLEPTALLQRLFPEDIAAGEMDEQGGLRLFPVQPVVHHCPDSREKITALLRSWGQAEAEAMLAEKGEIVICDEIGNRAYHFDAAEIERIFAMSTH